MKIVVERDKEEKTYEMKLKTFKEDPKRAGLGVSLITDRNVKVKPEVDMDIENIGGPSAGLMMSMEIYNQLTKRRRRKDTILREPERSMTKAKSVRSAASARKSLPQIRREPTSFCSERRRKKRI